MVNREFRTSCFLNFVRKEKLLLFRLIALLENLLLNFPLEPVAQAETN